MADFDCARCLAAGESLEKVKTAPESTCFTASVHNLRVRSGQTMQTLINAVSETDLLPLRLYSGMADAVQVSRRAINMRPQLFACFGV